MELVSVVIPTYNRAHVIKRAIESVLLQKYSNMEIIIIDDNSSDSTKEVIEGIMDSRIKYRRNSKNRGASFSRNAGIRMAKGEYIAFQDSDDEWVEGKLEKQLEIMKEMKCGMVYSMFSRDYGDGNIVSVPGKSVPKEQREGNIYPFLLRESFIGTPTMLIRKEVLRQVGSFDENLKNYEDYELAIRIAKNYKVGYVDEILTKAYTLGESIDFNPIYSIGSSVYILRKYEEDLKKYKIYEEKKQRIIEYGKECGLEGFCTNILEQYSMM